MHPALKRADPQTLRAFHAIACEIAEQMVEGVADGTITAQTFDACARFHCEHWLAQHKEDVPASRHAVFTDIMLDALRDAFGMRTANA